MFRRVRTWVNRLPLRNKLLTIFLLLGMLPIVLLAVTSYNLSYNILLNNTTENLQAMVAKNNELTTLKLQRIEDSSLMLTVDEELNALINQPTPPDKLDLLHGNLEIKRVLDQYFMSISGIFSCHLYTDYYMMVGNIADPTIPNSKPVMYVPYEEFLQSDLYKAASAANGKLVWYPTYQYEAMYGLEEYQKIDYNYPYLFSAVKQINCLYDTSGDRREPVMIVSFLPDFFTDIIQNETLEVEGTHYYVVSQDGQVIYDYGNELLTQPLPEALLNAAQEESGSTRLNYLNQDCLVVYDTLTYTGWKQIMVVPNVVYTRSLSKLPQILLLVSVLVAVVLSVLVCWITNSIVGNVKAVIAGMARLGEGEFMIHLPEPEDGEFGFLARRFNEMDERIHALIVENYGIKLREKEAQIMALNLQLNPHFLYNTLNAINWMAIDAGQGDISEALYRLSQMLQQSFRNKQDLCTVEDDLHWLNDYLYIMNLRFEGKFEVEIDMDDRLLHTLIPRSMFQPILENTIMHGFQDIDRGGVIRMEGTLREDGTRLFRIRDNGAGFAPGKVDAVLNADAEGVGLSNLNHRLQILYKDRYRLQIKTNIGEGTLVIIQLPADDSAPGEGGA